MNSESLRFLKKWKEPFIFQQNIPCNDFIHLLPKNVKKTKVGEVWDLIPRPKNEMSRLQLSSNR